MKRVDARIRVVLEELLKRGPKFSGGGIVVGDQVEELGGDPGVNPLDYREVVFQPVSVGGARHRGWMYMVAKTALSKVDVEEVAPVVVVVGGKIKRDQNKGRDIGICIGERGSWWHG
jgi:hypothetical protein